MPARYRRTSSRHSRGRTRRRLWITIDNSLLPSLTTGQFLGQDLLSGFGQLSTDAGCTFVKSLIQLTPNVAPALNDSVAIAVGKCRNTDFGANVVNGLAAADNNYPWIYRYDFTMNGGLTMGGGNVITIRARGYRRISADFEGVGLFITSNFVAATQWRLYARTLVLLP